MITVPRRRVLPVLLASAVLLSGCAATAAPSSANVAADSADTTDFVTPRTMPEGKGSGLADGVFPRTVVHFEGETTVPAAPQRIVVISTGQADALLTLGVVPIGSTAGEGAAAVPDYLFDAFPDDAAALAAVTEVGNRTAPDLETIATLDPDLILMNIAGKDADLLYSGLSAIAPTVAMQGTGLYWKQDFLLLADAVGRVDQATAWLADFQADAAEFGAGVTGDPTVSLLRSAGDRTRVFGVASFSGSVAEDAGLARPESQEFEDTSLDISAEQLDLADGDWLFYAVQGGDESVLTDAPLWPTLTAVAGKTAVPVDDDMFFLNVGPTAARGILATLESTLG
ncbi:ABC transporter substrate-binding protein [Cryobacterium sp. SO2]|uniref:ABC transporter substrate-binding protein n=1 Tax=Cryobacterium sp. SO2 TaxID=1897060 RepID=UPI00223D8CF1|nr:ABC transporter substrate-binding protein [Cryobacterium sp. SO2]WEO77842.1 ABC transporter substrate-binding protein [Cryobacterium sp. SO2]